MDTKQFDETVEKMRALFGRDYQFALATTSDQGPSLRFVDTYFDGKDFYVVTYTKSRKVMDIEKEPRVAICSRKAYSFSGIARNIGHPLLPENLVVRNILTEVFKDWYFMHNDEADPNMCYLKITPTQGFFHFEKTGYKMDFDGKTVTSFPFSFDTVCTEE